MNALRAHGPSRRRRGLRVAAALALLVPVPLSAQSVDPPAQETVELALDVPYVPQGRLLCGGAAAAMVLRYVGGELALAEDFGHLVRTDEGGIRTADLARSLEERGWVVEAGPGSPERVVEALAAGIPPIALVRSGPDRFHYVVIVGLRRSGWVVHDPQIAPDRTVPFDEMMEDWKAAGFWMLLVRPGRPGSGTVSEQAPATAAPRGDDSPAPARALLAEAERKFDEGRWGEAEALATAAAGIHPAAPAWDLAAASAYLDGRTADALRTWERTGGLGADLLQVRGLERVRYRPVADLVGIPPGSRLTADRFTLARRRLDLLPAARSTRLTYLPRSDGLAELEAVVLERPRFTPSGPAGLGVAGARVLVDRSVRVDVASPTGGGELARFEGRWQPGRSRAALRVETPAGGLGVLGVEGSWVRQELAGGEPGSPRPTETWRRGGVSLTNWLTAGVRGTVGLALERWDATGSYAVVEGSLEARATGGGVALIAEGTRRLGLQGVRGSGLGRVAVVTRSTIGRDGRNTLTAVLGAAGVSGPAPFTTWPGAGAPDEGGPLLRGHPLLDGDGRRKTEGVASGRSLLFASLEGARRLGSLGPISLEGALFVDLARARGAIPEQAATVTSDGSFRGVDAGGGLRLSLPGIEPLRIDAAVGVLDGATALTVSWSAAWPGVAGR